MGTALLNTVATNATEQYIASRGSPTPALQAEATVHGFDVGFWVAAGIFFAGALVTVLLLRRGLIVKEETRDVDTDVNILGAPPVAVPAP